MPNDRSWGSEGLAVLGRALVRERSGSPLFTAPRSRAPPSIAGDQAAPLDVEGPPRATRGHAWPLAPALRRWPAQVLACARRWLRVVIVARSLVPMALHHLLPLPASRPHHRL